MRTHYCGRLTAALLGKTVTLAGWAHRRRDHGGVIFIDLRDREGLAQVVSDPDRKETFATAERIRNEFVLKVTGVVRRRPQGTINPNIASGEVEVLAHAIEILNPSLTPPFQLDDEHLSETVRPDRQPEFTQIDCETSFLEETEIRGISEGLIRTVFEEVLGVALTDPFPMMSYAEATRDYGSDKPDLRVPLKLTELTQVMKSVEFKVFSGPANAPAHRVAGLLIPKGGELTRGEIDAYTEFVGIYGAKGLAWIKFNDIAKGREGMQSPIVKNLSDAALKAVVDLSGAKNGDLMFFGAGKIKVVNDALGALRVKIGHEKGYAGSGWKPLWVVDFPMFEYDEEAKRWNAMHHPFTAPKEGHEDLLARDPGAALAKAYDMVLNGSEIGGGSVRIHREEVQSKVFRALSIGPEEAKHKFGFLLEALQYGAPPHGGIAFGLDRIVAMMAGAESIRDVIAFPKTQRAQDLLTHAPSPVDEKQLRELHIRLRTTERNA